MKKTSIFLVFVIALLFIWAQSTLPPQMSSNESECILNLIRPILEFLFGEGNATHSLVRKMAHYTEYAVFGFIVFYLFEKDTRKKFVQFVFCLSLCLAVSFIDESIQYVSGRGPSIIDIWIDLSGAFVGAFVGLINCRKH